MEDYLQQRTYHIFHDNCPGKMRHVSPQGLLGNWPFDVQVDHPWCQIEWPRMEDHWQRGTRYIFHDYQPGKLRPTSHHRPLDTRPVVVQVEHQWLLEVMLERRDILLLGIPLPPQIGAVFITCTSSFLWENSQQCFLETDMFQKLGFIWMSLFLPLEMRHKEKCWE